MTPPVASLPAVARKRRRPKREGFPNGFGLPVHHRWQSRTSPLDCTGELSRVRAAVESGSEMANYIGISLCLGAGVKGIVAARSESASGRMKPRPEKCSADQPSEPAPKFELRTYGICQEANSWAGIRRCAHDGGALPLQHQSGRPGRRRGCGSQSRLPGRRTAVRRTCRRVDGGLPETAPQRGREIHCHAR